MRIRRPTIKPAHRAYTTSLGRTASSPMTQPALTSDPIEEFARTPKHHACLNKMRTNRNEMKIVKLSRQHRGASVR